MQYCNALILKTNIPNTDNLFDTQISNIMKYYYHLKWLF